MTQPDDKKLKRALAVQLDYADEPARIRKLVGAMLLRGVPADDIGGIVQAVTGEPDKPAKPERDPEGQAFIESLWR